MPLETAQYLSDLNPNFPNVTDPTSQGDDHLRLIKSALKATFPNVTGPVTGSHTELNAAVTAASTGANKLSDSGASFNSNPGDGFTNPAAGEVDLTAGGNVVAKLKSDKSTAFQGAVSSVGPITGPGATPIGGTIVWWSDVLPDASWGTWTWCNGAEYQRSNTALWNVLGTKYGTGNGTSTANLPDLRDNVPVGKGTMGGVAAAGRITNFTTTVLGTIIGACNKILVRANLPNINFSVDIPSGQGSHAHVIAQMTNAPTGFGGGGSGTPWIVGGSYSTNSATLPALTGTAPSGGSDTPVDLVQPSIVCNWIIRIA